MKTGHELTRRHFLQLSSLLTALPYLPVLSAASASTVSIEKMMIINGLGGISNQNLWVRTQAAKDESMSSSAIRRMRSIDTRAIRDAHTSGTTAVNATLGYVAGPGDPYEDTVNDVAEWNALIRNYSKDLRKVWTAEDIVQAQQENKIGIIFGFQNARCLGDKLERVRTFSRLGVRIIQLTYNDANQLGDGSGVPENRGLSQFGKDAVAALNENKVLVDLSHSGENTCLDAIVASKSPITISHTGCRALNDIPRNKTDKEMRMVADRGGVVGIYFMPFLKADGQARADDVVRHLEHALKICGEDHVGIGTDGDSTAIDDMQEYRQAIAGEIQQRRQAGVSAKGESSKVVPLIPDLSGPDQFRKLADMLIRRGHSSRVIEKILGANFLRLMREVWSA